MKRIDHELIIRQYEDGSHYVECNPFNDETFPAFMSYVMSAGFGEHLIDILPDRLVLELGGCIHEEEPVIEPSEVFNGKDDVPGA